MMMTYAQCRALFRFFWASYGLVPYLAVQCLALCCLIAMLLLPLKPTYFVSLFVPSSVLELGNFCLLPYIEGPPWFFHDMAQMYMSFASRSYVYASNLIEKEEYQMALSEIKTGNFVQCAMCFYLQINHVKLATDVNRYHTAVISNQMDQFNTMDRVISEVS